MGRNAQGNASPDQSLKKDVRRARCTIPAFMPDWHTSHGSLEGAAIEGGRGEGQHENILKIYMSKH